MSTRDRTKMLEVQLMILEEALIQEAQLDCDTPSPPAPVAVCENAQKTFLAVDRDPGPVVKPRTLH